MNIACSIMNSNRVRKVKKSIIIMQQKSIYVEVLDKYMDIDKMIIQYRDHFNQLKAGIKRRRFIYTSITKFEVTLGGERR